MAHLASSGAESSLRNVALVSKRFYAPTRRHSKWETVGLHSALHLLDVALEFPSFAGHIRDLSFRYHEFEQSPPLANRAITLLVAECPKLRQLRVGGLLDVVNGEAAQARLMETVGQLTHLVSLDMGHEYPAELPLAALPLLVPVFHRLRHLTLGVSAAERNLLPRPPHPLLTTPLPSFTIDDVTVDLNTLQYAELANVIGSLVKGARRASVNVSETMLGEPILNAQDLASLVSSWTPSALELGISSFKDIRHNEPLPFPPLPCTIVSVVSCYASLQNAYAYLGTWSEIKDMPWKVLDEEHMGNPKTWRVEVRRGEEMSNDEALELRCRLYRRGFDVKWFQ